MRSEKLRDLEEEPKGIKTTLRPPGLRTVNSMPLALSLPAHLSAVCL